MQRTGPVGVQTRAAHAGGLRGCQARSSSHKIIRMARTLIMLRFCLSFVLLFGSLVVAGAAPNLRVMPPAELAANSVIVARVRVVAVDESEWADFRQMATLELEDVIEGDFTLRQVKVAARSLLAY